MPGVHYVLDGARACGRHAAAADRPRHAERAAPAAGGRRCALCRRMGRRRGRRHAARWPRTRPSQSTSTTSRCRSCSMPNRRSSRRHAGAPGARLQRAARQDLRLGRGREGFRRKPAQTLATGQMGPQRRPCRSRPSAWRRAGTLARNSRRLGLDPDAEISRPDRRRAEDADARRCACTTTSTSAAATASSAASSTPCWSAISRGGSASRCA